MNIKLSKEQQLPAMLLVCCGIIIAIVLVGNTTELKNRCSAPATQQSQTTDQQVPAVETTQF